MKGHVHRLGVRLEGQLNLNKGRITSGFVLKPTAIHNCYGCSVGKHQERSSLGYVSPQLPSKEKYIRHILLTDPRHVLSRLLPEVKSTSYNLRPRAHCFVLPTKDTRN